MTINTSNTNRVNAPIKRHGVDESIQKQDTHRAMCMSSTSDLNTHSNQKQGDVKGIPCKWNDQKPGVIIFISDKIDFIRNTLNKRQRRPLNNDKGINPIRICYYVVFFFMATAVN